MGTRYLEDCQTWCRGTPSFSQWVHSLTFQKSHGQRPMALPFAIATHFLLAGQMPMYCQAQICPGCLWTLAEDVSSQWKFWDFWKIFGILKWFLWSINETSWKGTWGLLQAAADRQAPARYILPAGWNRLLCHVVNGSESCRSSSLLLWTFSCFICPGTDYFTHIHTTIPSECSDFLYIQLLDSCMHTTFNPFVFFRLARKLAEFVS